MKYFFIELEKIKRKSIWIVLIIITLLINILSVIQGAYGGNLSFSSYSNTLIWNHACFLYPFMITLLGGYLFDQEYKNNTLKNMYLIPVSNRIVLFSKLAVTLFILYSLVAGEFIFSVIISFCMKVELNHNLLLLSARQQFMFAACSFVSVLPIIITTSRKENAYLTGTLLAAFFGVCGVSIATRKLGAYYPFTAGLWVIDFKGNMVTIDLNLKGQSVIILGIVLLLSIFLVTFQRNNIKPCNGLGQQKRNCQQ